MYNSYDVFDTVIGRLTYKGGDVIFDIIEKKYKINNFKTLRKSYEIKYRDFDLIYHHLKSVFNNAEEIKNFELFLEYDLSFPIISNISKVKKDDIFISDMYLNEKQILNLLNKHGEFNNKVYVDYDHKKTNKIWSMKDITDNIIEHVGDNILADYENPKKFNIKSFHFNPNLTNNEKKFDNLIGNLLRAVRLSLPEYKDEKMNVMGNIFCNFSCQFLILICIKLRQILIENNLNTIIFLSRDGYWFKKMYDILFKQDKSHYMYFSREAVKKDKHSIINKINSIQGDKLVFDLQGSGKTFNSLELTNVYYVLCFKSASSQHKNCIFHDDIYKVKPYIEDIFSAPHGSFKENNYFLNPEYDIKYLKPYMVGIDLFKNYFETVTKYFKIDLNEKIHLNNLYNLEINIPSLKKISEVIKHAESHDVKGLEFPLTFYSQINQDKYFIENISKYNTNGVFVEIGGYDGIIGSNTYFLEKNLNWKGVVVECNPELASKCRINRNCKICEKAIYKNSDEEVEFLVPTGEEIVGGKEQLGGIKNFLKKESLDVFNRCYKENYTIKVKTISFNKLMEENELFEIDYLSLDIEGYELEVLKSIDFNKFFIKFMTVEFGNVRKYQQEIYNFLTSNNFRLHRNNKWDDEYINVSEL